MFQVQFIGRAAVMNQTEFMTAGSVGIQIGFGFDGAWDGLTKTAVFRGSGVSCDVMIGSTGQMLVPPEAMARAGAKVEVGVYGTNGQGTVVIPTVWVVLGRVEAGAVISGTAAAAITPTLAQQVLTAAKAAQDAAETVQDAAEDAKDAAEAAAASAAAAPSFTAYYEATADAKTGALTFSATEDWADIKAAMEAGQFCLAKVKVGYTSYFAPVAAWTKSPQHSPWQTELVSFHGPALQVKHSSNGTVEGSIAVS